MSVPQRQTSCQILGMKTGVFFTPPGLLLPAPSLREGAPLLVPPPALDLGAQRRDPLLVDPRSLHAPGRRLIQDPLRFPPDPTVPPQACPGESRYHRDGDVLTKKRSCLKRDEYVKEVWETLATPVYVKRTNKKNWCLVSFMKCKCCVDVFLYKKLQSNTADRCLISESGFLKVSEY